LRNRFAALLTAEARINPSIILVTGDLGYGVLTDFAAELPNQFINAGISEQSMMSLSGGMASRDFHPFVYSIANFPTFRCLEQIRNDISYMGNRVCIVSVGAGFAYGSQGYSHHAIEDIAIMRAIPNLQIYNPADSIEMEFALNEILDSPNPSYLRLGKGGEPNIHDQALESMSNPIKVRQGDRGALIFSGTIGVEVLHAWDLLREKGISPSVYSLPRIFPAPDLSMLGSDRKTGPILTVEEHSLTGGFGSAFLEWSSDQKLNLEVQRMGVRPESNGEIGSQSYQRRIHEIDAQSIVNTFLNCLR
jgi:transketolase